MSDPAIVNDEGMVEVYQGGVYQHGLLHFPGEPGLTRCGLDTANLDHRFRPADWAGIWCTACLAPTKENA